MKMMKTCEEGVMRLMVWEKMSDYEVIPRIMSVHRWRTSFTRWSLANLLNLTEEQETKGRS